MEYHQQKNMKVAASMDYGLFLSHHGILGQKWGKRNGPPYPLGSSDHSASEKKAGWQKSLDKQEKTSNTKSSYSKDEQNNEKRGLTDKQKKYIKIGVATVATALAAYGTYKLTKHMQDSGEFHRLVEKGKAFVNGTRPTWDSAPELANTDWSAQNIYDNIVTKINPNYGSPGTANNCRRCTFAYELNRRGFDVVATKSMKGTGQNEYGLLSAIDGTGKKHSVLEAVAKFYKGDKEMLELNDRSVSNCGLFGIPIKLQKGQAHQNVFDTLSKMPNGARGELAVKFSNCSVRHSMAWEIIKGKPVIFECQASKMYDSPESFASFASQLSNMSFTRLDNIKLNDDFLLRWVRNTW